MSAEVVVDKYPLCDFTHVIPTLATFDAKTKMGPWANMCPDHWLQYGIGKLGTGYGQRLKVKS